MKGLEERLYMLEAERDEGREIEAEILAALAGKGYTLVWHAGRPCYGCTISRLVDKLQVQDRAYERS